MELIQHRGDESSRPEPRSGLRSESRGSSPPDLSTRSDTSNSDGSSTPARRTHENPVNPETEVLASEFLQEPELTAEDFTKAVAVLSANFGVDYTAKDPDGNPTGDSLKVRSVFRILRRQRYSRRELRDTLDHFFTSCRWPSWTIADFFAGGRLKLYGRQWYEEQLAKNSRAGALIGVYRRGRSVRYAWRSEVGGRIEEFRPERLPETKSLPAAPEPIDEETRADLRSVKIRLELESRIQQLETENRQLRRRVSELELSKETLLDLLEPLGGQDEEGDPEKPPVV